VLGVDSSTAGWKVVIRPDSLQACPSVAIDASRIGGTHYCAPPPRNRACASSTHTARASPVGGSGVKGCWFPACAGGPALAVCVYETGAVRWAVPHRV
jgi:hypothetical protein